MKKKKEPVAQQGQDIGWTEEPVQVTPEVFKQAVAAGLAQKPEDVLESAINRGDGTVTLTDGTRLIIGKDPKKAIDTILSMAAALSEGQSIEMKMQRPTPPEVPQEDGPPFIVLHEDIKTKDRLDRISHPRYVLYRHSRKQVVLQHEGFIDTVALPNDKFVAVMFAKANPGATDTFNFPTGQFEPVLKSDKSFDTPAEALQIMSEFFPTLPMYHSDLGRYVYPNIKSVMTPAQFEIFEKAHRKEERRMRNFAKSIKRGER